MSIRFQSNWLIGPRLLITVIYAASWLTFFPDNFLDSQWFHTDRSWNWFRRTILINAHAFSTQLFFFQTQFICINLNSTSSWILFIVSVPVKSVFMHGYRNEHTNTHTNILIYLAMCACRNLSIMSHCIKHTDTFRRESYGSFRLAAQFTMLRTKWCTCRRVCNMACHQMSECH